MRKVKMNDREFDSHICKYFTIDNNFYNSILNSFLWFSDPKDFNDPYDLNINLILPEYNRDDISKLVELFKEKGIAFGIGDEEIINYFIANPDKTKEQLQNYYSNYLVPNIGVCCFSQDEYNLLMWSHYADKHKGICLKYDMYKDEKFFTIPLKVDYPDNYPIFDFFKIRETNQLVQFLLGTKSNDWKYENEIRIIKDKNQFGKFREAINFNKSSLIEVIFGYKTDEPTISNIKTLLKGIGYDCLFSRVDLIENNFGLKKIPI